MYRTVYVSSASRGSEEKDIRQILEQSHRNNAALGVTGALLFHDGNFLQILEGERDAVEALYARIGRDPRHRGMLRLLGYACDTRLFAQWTMGYADPAALQGAEPGIVQSLWTLCSELGGAEQGDARIRTMVGTFMRSFERRWASQRAG